MSNPAKQSGECQACLEKNELIVLPCGHASFCSECTIRRFSNITESRPATCLVCSSAVPLDSLKSILPEDLYAKLETDLHEWSVPGPQRLYCPNTACTKFIHPSDYKGHQCPFCAVKICTCKCLAHEGECVDPFRGTRECVDSANSKQCSVCGNLVERHQGCQHMICVKCDHHFCILCARDWNLCRASCEGSTADANINHGEHTETIRSLLNRLLVAMVMGREYLARLNGGTTPGFIGFSMRVVRFARLDADLDRHVPVAMMHRMDQLENYLESRPLRARPERDEYYDMMQDWLEESALIPLREFANSDFLETEAGWASSIKTLYDGEMDVTGRDNLILIITGDLRASLP